MLDKKRIEEAVRNMGQYSLDGLVKKEPFRKIVFDTLMRNHRESLDLADVLISKNLSNLWTIVISYYSMFYIANAVLYKRGYKVGEKIAHKITADALIVIIKDKLIRSLLKEYEDAKEEALSIAGTKADNIIDSFDKERGKRSNIQYETTEEIKKGKAEISFARAKMFSTEMQKLM